MTIKTSTGLRDKLLATGALRTVLNLGFIHLYSGTPPASADDSVAGNTLLRTYSVNASGVGLTLAATATSGVITKNSSEVWSGVGLANGTATFYRHVAPSDTGALSTTEARIQGSVGAAGADMNLSSVAVETGITKALDFYAIVLPTA